MDSFFGIGVFELVFILIFALIFLGPERLPEAMRQVIGAIRQIRSLTSDITKQFNEEFGDLAELDPRRQLQQALKEDSAPEKTAPKKTTPPKKTVAKTTPKPASKTVATAKKSVAAEPKAAAESDSTAQNVDEGKAPVEAEPASTQAEQSTTVAVHPTPDAETSPDEASPAEDSPASSPAASEPEESTPGQGQQPAAEAQDADQNTLPASLAQTSKTENGTIHGAGNTNHSGSAERKDVPAHSATEDRETVDSYSIAPPNLREPDSGEQSTDGSAEPAEERSKQRAAEEESA